MMKKNHFATPNGVIYLIKKINLLLERLLRDNSDAQAQNANLHITC